MLVILSVPSLRAASAKELLFLYVCLKGPKSKPQFELLVKLSLTPVVDGKNLFIN